MKTYSKYLLIATFIFTLTNCSNDDDGTTEPVPTISELLLGKWFLKEVNGISVPEGCLDQSYYHFFDGQNMVSERFNTIEFSCISSGLYASSYTINETNEVVFDTQDNLLGVTSVTLEILEISTTELTGTFNDRFGGVEYKLIKQ